MKNFFAKKTSANHEKTADKPIYLRIKQALGADGRLPAGFDLSAPLQPGQIGFAPGAMDGIVLYHSGGGGDKQLLADLQQVTGQAAQGTDFAETEKRLAACFARREKNQEGKLVGSHDGMLGCIDGLQDWIIEHKEELPPQRLFGFAVQVLQQTASVGAVKYALSVLELLAGAGGGWRELVRTLALYDEFTLYCVFVARQWNDANRELWQMARKVEGWGRVHAVAELEPENQEMADWLLDEGWKNGVLAAYSALQCALKGKLAERLQQDNLTVPQLAAAAGLIGGLLDEGPLLGISDERLTAPDALLASFLAQSGRLAYHIESGLLREIIGTAAEHGWAQVQAQAEQILSAYPEDEQSMSGGDAENNKLENNKLENDILENDK